MNPAQYFRSLRAADERATRYRDQLTTTHAEVARLTRELVRAETDLREERGRRPAAVPELVILRWSDGYDEQVRINLMRRQ